MSDQTIRLVAGGVLLLHGSATEEPSVHSPGSAFDPARRPGAGSRHGRGSSRHFPSTRPRPPRARSGSFATGPYVLDLATGLAPRRKAAAGRRLEGQGPVCDHETRPGARRRPRRHPRAAPSGVRSATPMREHPLLAWCLTECRSAVALDHRHDLIAISFELRRPHPTDAPERRQGAGSRFGDRLERGVVGDDIGGDGVGSRAFESPRL